MRPVFFNSGADFRSWLQKYHATQSELLLGLHRKKRNCGVTYAEALDEALCFGWIDGVRKRIDAESYSIRFSPRKPGSIWSQINLRHAERLVSVGRMHATGLRVYRERDVRKQRIYTYEREDVSLDPTLESTLRANRKAASFFEAQPPGYRRTVTKWIMAAKQEETRARRLAQVITCSAKGKRIDALSPYRK